MPFIFDYYILIKSIPLVGIDIDINWSDVVRPTSLRAFKAHKRTYDAYLIVKY